MLGHNIFIWNVRGLNMCARRDVVREFLLQEHVMVACLVETKLDVLLPPLANKLMGTSFDYACLPSSGASGSIVLALAMHGLFHGKRLDVSRLLSALSHCALPRGRGRSQLSIDWWTKA